MSSWQHYPWISAPKRFFKDAIWYYDWVSVFIVIDWKDNTMVAVEICLVKDIYRMANYVSILIKSSVYILKILSHISVLSQRKIFHAYYLLIWPGITFWHYIWVELESCAHGPLSGNLVSDCRCTQGGPYLKAPVSWVNKVLPMLRSFVWLGLGPEMAFWRFIWVE